MAGCLLTFTNPGERVRHPHLDSLHPEQTGTIGDLTASRKVRVLDVPLSEVFGMEKRGERPSEYLANCLYLEWFSERNGRVVVESANYELTISSPAWTPAPEEEAERARQAAAGMQEFLGRLTEAMEQHQRSSTSAARKIPTPTEMSDRSGHSDEVQT